MSEQIHVRMQPALRRLIEEEADSNYPNTLNDIINRILAKHYKRPDLAVPPRKRMGRPPKVESNGV